MADERRMEELRRQSDERLVEPKRRSEERFARIEATMSEILHVLNEHTRLFERLPEAIREKVGFRPQS